MKWEDVAGRLLASWPQHIGQWKPGVLVGFCAELERRGLTPETAMGALDGYTGTFPPSAPELAALSPEQHISNPVEAWALVEEAIRKFGCSIYSEEFAARHQEAVDYIADRDPVVAFWAAQRGLFQQHGSLGQEPINGEQGGAVRHRLEKEYGAVVQQVQERVALGKPLTARELTVRTADPQGGGMGDVVEALRPAAQIGESSG